jgi:hypothetical protein
MKVKERLESRIRGWFPQEPVLKKQVQSSIKSTSSRLNTLRKLEGFLFGALWIAAVFFMSGTPSFGSYVDVFRVIFLLVILATAGVVAFRLRRYGGLGDLFSVFSFYILMSLVFLGGVLFWFRTIDTTGFWALTGISASIFTILYVWAQRTPQQQNVTMLKAFSLIIAILGVIALSSALAITPHVEAQLTPVTHGESILNNNFSSDQPIPDTEVSANLTTQDNLYISIIVGTVYGSQRGASSVNFSISDQPSTSTSPADVYLNKDNITNYFDKNWQVPQNGTYYLKISYNVSGANYFSQNIVKHWSVNELKSTEVFTPVLAENTLTTLILAAALMATSMAFPIKRRLK